MHRIPSGVKEEGSQDLPFGTTRTGPLWQQMQMLGMSPWGPEQATLNSNSTCSDIQTIINDLSWPSVQANWWAKDGSSHVPMIPNPERENRKPLWLNWILYVGLNVMAQIIWENSENCEAMVKWIYHGCCPWTMDSYCLGAQRREKKRMQELACKV